MPNADAKARWLSRSLAQASQTGSRTQVRVSAMRAPAREGANTPNRSHRMRNHRCRDAIKGSNQAAGEEGDDRVRASCARPARLPCFSL